MKFRKDLPEGGGGNYLKLKDKQSVVGVFLGDTYEFFTVWENGRGRVVPEGSPGAKFRFRINFVIKEGASYVPKVWEQGQMVYEKLSALHDEYNLETAVIKITRRGEGLETEYDLLPLRDPVTPEAREVMRSLKLHDLKSLGQTSNSVPDFGRGPQEGPPDLDDIPF